MVVAGCGHTTSNNTTLAATASARTTAAGSFEVALTSRTFETAHPSRVDSTSTGHGVVDLRHTASHLIFDATSRSEIVTIGHDVWIKSPFPSGNAIASLGGLSVASKPWLHVPRRSGAPTVPGGFDPTTMLERLRAKGATLRLLGHDAVRGARTDHYAITLPRGRASADAVYEKTELETWIDANQLVRRLLIRALLKPQHDSEPPTPAETLEGTIDYFNFGVTADIQPPPSDQVGESPTIPACDSASTTTTVQIGFVCKP